MPLAVNSSGIQAVSVSPKTGTGLGPQTFTALYTDSSGYKDLQVVYLNFASPTASCMVSYDQSANAVYLYNDTGQALGPIPPGGKQSNSQCTLFGSGSGVNTAGTPGNNLSVSFNITFRSTSPGAWNIYAYARSYSGANSAWQTLGSWTIPGQFTTTGVTSVTPNGGTGTGPATFTVVAADPYGAADLTVVFLEFASSAGAAQSCFAVYMPAGNKLYLYSDDNTSLLPVSATGAASNHQCTLSAGGTSTSSGNNLTVPFTVKFLPGFTGSKNMYAYAQSAIGNSAGWQLVGSWTPQ
jgi:trimeric autotransporter adhesin